MRSHHWAGLGRGGGESVRAKTERQAGPHCCLQGAPLPTGLAVSMAVWPSPTSTDLPLVHEREGRQNLLKEEGGSVDLATLLLGLHPKEPNARP